MERIFRDGLDFQFVGGKANFKYDVVTIYGTKLKVLDAACLSIPFENIYLIMNEVLGLITARGGSKTVPNKNVTLLAKKPLIAWTIGTALKSHSLNRVIVSTEDEEIAKISREWGAEVPFLRPIELAQDDTPHIPVIAHAVEWLDANEGAKYEYIVLLQPTSPFRSVEDIDNVVRLAIEKKADSVVSVCNAQTHPYRTKRLAVDGRLENFLENIKDDIRRQDLPPAYELNGAIYLVRRDVLLERQTLYTDQTHAYIMPQERSLDIDTAWDLHLARLILNDRNDFELD